MEAEASAGEAWAGEATAEEAGAERERPNGPPRNSASREVIASTRWPLRYLPGLLTAILFVAAPALAGSIGAEIAAGHGFHRSAQITPANVDNLVRAWQFRTGDLEARPPAAMAQTKFEATPLFVETVSIFCSPFNEVIAVDPGTGYAEVAIRSEDFAPASAPQTAIIAAASRYWVDDAG